MRSRSFFGKGENGNCKRKVGKKKGNSTVPRPQAHGQIV